MEVYKGELSGIGFELGLWGTEGSVKFDRYGLEALNADSSIYGYRDEWVAMAHKILDHFGESEEVTQGEQEYVYLLCLDNSYQEVEVYKTLEDVREGIGKHLGESYDGMYRMPAIRVERYEVLGGKSA